MVNPTDKITKFCAICGRPANSRHFGAFSCKACAAFFRRTVTGKKSFTCERQRNCVIDSRPYQLICQACRWQKCISAGMIPSEVVSLGLPRKSRRKCDQKKQPSQLPLQKQSSPEKQQKQAQLTSANAQNPVKDKKKQSPVAVNVYRSASMPKLQKFDHNSTFSSYQNHEWLRKLNFVNTALRHERKAMLPPINPFHKKSSIVDITNYVVNDSRFCHMYLTETGILNIASEVIDKKLPEVILHWSYLTTLLNTLQYDSINLRKVTCMDYSTVEMSEASLREWYSTNPMFSKHYDILVSHGMQVWFRTEEILRKIRSLGMTSEEQTCFAILSMIETITRLSSEPTVTRVRFKPLLDNVFRSMNMYYRDNFSQDCAATRIGNLIMALPLMTEMFNIHSEHRILIIICHGVLENPMNDRLYKTFRSRSMLKY